MPRPRVPGNWRFRVTASRGAESWRMVHRPRVVPTDRRLGAGTEEGRRAIRLGSVQRLGQLQPAALAECPAGQQHNFGERQAS